MNKFIMLSIILFSFSICGAQESFEKFEDSLSALKGSNQYDLALAYIDQNQNKFPAHDFELSDHKVNIYLSQKDFDKAKQVWSAGHNLGYFYMLHPEMPQFRMLKKDSLFLKVAQKDLRLRRKTNDTSHTTYEVKLPDNYSKAKNYPLLLVLHGGGSTIERSQKNWQSQILSDEYITVYLNSYRHYNYKKYGWSSGDTKTSEHIFEIYHDLINGYNIDSSRIYIGGISAGGSMSLDLALNNVIPVKGVIGVCPTKPRTFAKNLVEAAQKRNLKVYFICGGKDMHLKRQNEMADIFEECTLSFEKHVIDEMGHTYPDDFKSWIEKGLTFLK